MDFDRAFEKLIGHEGGFTDNPADRGNWTEGQIGQGKLRGTKFGISAMAYPNLDIKALTLDHAKLMYKRDYWDRIITPETPDVLKFSLFDVAVNSGVKAAAQLLQKALGVDPDGKIGPATRGALKKANPHRLVNRLSAHRLMLITGMGRSKFDVFGKGLVNRVAANLIDDNTER